MYACPTCKKLHEEKTFYCDECCEYYCSLACFKYQDFHDYYVHGISEISDLTFSCCNIRYCMKCYIDIINLDRGEIIFLCDKCGRFFHDNCSIDSLKQENEGCMCRLCVDLKNSKTNLICRQCHEDCNVTQFSFSCLNDLEQDIHVDFSNCKKFNQLLEVVSSWKDEISECVSVKCNCEICEDIDNELSYIALLHLHKEYSEDQEHYIPDKLLSCKKYKRNAELLDSRVDRCLDCLSQKCDCDMCTNIQCNTTLMRLMFGDKDLNDEINYWDLGNEITPVEVLKALSENTENKCNCKICQCWKQYY